MPRFSLFAMFLLFPMAAMLSMEISVPPVYEIRETGQKLDLAIVGKGCFKLFNLKDQRQHITRSGRIDLDEYGQFVVRIGNQEYLLDPPLSCPEDSKEIRFNRNGTVDALCNDDWVQIGHVQIVRLRDGVQLNNPLSATPLYEYEVSNDAFISEPGFDGAGYLRQGYRETRKLLVPHRVLGMILVGVMAISWKWRPICLWSGLRRPSKRNLFRKMACALPKSIVPMERLVEQ
jgi:hypothetical protein